jgi:HAD superfamily hydrolase (TIGR01509 family)
MNAPLLKALIFDVDGTLADTEQAHLAAFNAAFVQEGLPWHWDVENYTVLLGVSGGKERIAHYWRQVQPDLKIIDNAAFTDTVQRIHDLKTAVYERMVNDGAVQFRPGVLRLIEQAHEAGLQLAIATTTSPVNILALLRAAIGPEWSRFFVVIEDASTAPRKKPHPQVYLQTLSRLKLPAMSCVAIEDSANGLRSASAAGLQTLITKNFFTERHDFSGAMGVLHDLADCNLAQITSMHAAALSK